VLGSEILSTGGVRFTVWAPRARALAVRLLDPLRDVAMERGPGDVWSATVPSAGAGTRYFFLIDGDRTRPDPRSRRQPDGVHGPSEVVDPGTFSWRHAAPRRSIAEGAIYELHVGTFTREGTFRAAAEALPVLRDLGVGAVELMPVAEFPGGRNWGYDGVDLFAPAAAYGTPDDLRALVDRAHGLGLSVILDVVYNHLGPEGNYLSDYAPYFTPERRNLWGDGIDFERREVRDYIIDNALHWLREYRIDGLRLDAVHAIVDHSARHVLAELCERARPAFLIAETDLNDSLVYDQWGFDACWSDDFHHALHACLTSERGGYYRDFGDPATLALAIERGWIRGPHPERSRPLEGDRLIISTQTHDQIGNRAGGERLEHLIGPEAARLAAVALLTAPGIPMLFMGEEFAARQPFHYFTSHGDPELARAVRDGRRREFADQGFAWPDDVPDPQDEGSFRRSTLDLDDRRREPHAGMLRLYRDLLALRVSQPALGARGKARCQARLENGAIFVQRDPGILVCLNVGHRAMRVDGRWRAVLHTEHPRYGGRADSESEIPPRAAAVYVRSRG
jgi:maltooligosyltrehalose trehalohydrolase